MDAMDLHTDIAVVGMGCRFPHASGVSEFWDNLINNVDSVDLIPSDRFDVTPLYSEEAGVPGTTVSRHGGFVRDPFAFDPAFFGIAPTEATAIDPQHRLLLHVVWEALEDAGLPASALAGSRSGVFIGQATADYARDVPYAEHSLQEATGSHLRAMASGRVSYALDLRGPSMTVDTACSSSLVAVHSARQSLITGESDLAIAGGVNIILSPQDAIAYSQASMLSPDGRCKFGDAAADGFVRSEGVGVVVLKRLADAERDGDQVLALLAGSAVTNDGRSSGLLLQPAVPGQVHTLQMACRSAGIRPHDLDYVEAHGTGTAVGDGVELCALAESARDGGAPRRKLRTGSVKSNIGHTEAAAGVAGLIKAVLVARHGVIPASLQVRTQNPMLSAAECPVELVTRNTPLEKLAQRAHVGVSSFGLSGTNAHVVVTEYVPESKAAAPKPQRLPGELPAGRPLHLLVLSARSSGSLSRLALSYAGFLEPGGAGRKEALWDVCASAAVRRDAHPYRLWVTGTDHDEIAAGLRALAEGRETTNGSLGHAGFYGPRRTVFVFPGQGSQWLGMGRSLLKTSASFRTAMEACERAVLEETNWSVVDVLTGDAGEFPTEVEKVQPVLWAMEVALAAHWRDMGVEPDVCLGHSMGETAAAVVSAGLTLRDAASAICRRSRLMARVAGSGGMLATELTPDQAREVVRTEEPAICVAAENGPASTVLAGDRSALERVAERLEQRGIFSRSVQVDVASHSPVMDGLRDDLLRELSALAPAAPRVPLYSTVRCAPIREADLDAAYWMSNLREPVRFSDSIRKVADEGQAVFVEVSPHPILESAIRQTLRADGGESAVVTSTRRGQDEALVLAQSLGQLFANGGNVEWERWFRGEVRRVSLPSYPWETEFLRRVPSLRASDSLDTRARSAAVWENEVRLDEQVAGVSLRGLAPVPPTTYLAVLHQAAASSRAVGAEGALVIEHAKVGGMFVDVTAGHGVTLRTSLQAKQPDGSRAATVRAFGDPGRGPVLCLEATVRSAAAGAADGGVHPALRGKVDAALARCRGYRSGARFLEDLGKRGYEIGPAFRAVRHLWRRDGEAVAHLHCSDELGQAAWEVCLQPLLAALPRTLAHRFTYHPVGFESVRFFTGLPQDAWVHARFTTQIGGPTAQADVVVCDREGRAVAVLSGVQLRRTHAASAPGIAPLPTQFTPYRLAARLLRDFGDTVRRPLSVATSVVDAMRVAAREEGSPSHRAAPAPALAPAARPTAPSDARTSAVPPRETDDEVLVRCAAALLGMPPERIDGRRPLRDYGLDSLMATRLSRQLQVEHGLDVPVRRLLGEEGTARLARQEEGRSHTLAGEVA